MSVNYNTLKTLKGTSIGTIVPWCGAIGAIPKGWLICNGDQLDTNEFQDLFDMLGYRYGGSGNSFKIPRLNGKEVVDYHTNHSSLFGSEMDPLFQSQINDLNETENDSTSLATSKIDLFVSVDPVSNLRGTLTDFDANPPIYFDAILSQSRMLGDHHLAAHSHPETQEVIAPPEGFIESCQSFAAEGFNACFLNCFTAYPLGPCCDDQCDDYQVYKNEANTRLNRRTQIYIFESANSLESLFTKASGNNGFGLIPSSADFELTTDPYNHLLSSFDTIEATTSQGGGNPINNNSILPYPVNLATDIINFQSSPEEPTPHRHPDQFFEIQQGNFFFDSQYTLNNITTGNVTPLNSTITDIAEFTADVITPTLQIIHIIRAF